MKKILTIVLDGLGLREEEKGNAVKEANMPNFNYLWETYPHAQLLASEEAVGLPKGQMGNSEVGHETIGAGHKVQQPLLTINEILDSEDYLNDNIFRELVKHAITNQSSIHLFGLTSNGGIHAHIDHLKKLLGQLKKAQVPKVYLHIITDGRDTETDASLSFMKEIYETTKELNIGSIATICGRYYAMDRDQKWERTKYFYDLLVRGTGVKCTNINDSINACYHKQVTDEFLPPMIIESNATIKNNDVVICFNYRNDRIKQIFTALADEQFNRFPTVKINNVLYYSFYDVEVPNVKPLFFDEKINNPLGVYLSKLGLTQARVAEGEKFPHVTYFFDGGYEGKLDKCDTFNIPSPKVATYDLKPEMSAVEVAKRTVTCMEKDYDFILTNFANPDMVGHTGMMAPTVRALEVVDMCLGKIIEYADRNFYTIILLADHGNADYMLNENNEAVTTHSISPVPFIITDNKISLNDGDLTNVAPTILQYMDIKAPNEMTSSSLIK